MSEKFKSTAEVEALAQTLKKRRIALGLTLQDVEKNENIDFG